MTVVPKDRALWLARHVLPHEGALRKWLSTRPRGDLEIDDIVQETYVILSNLETVDHVAVPRNYAFQVAHSIIQAYFKRSRVVAFRPIADWDVVNVHSNVPSPETEASDKEYLRLVEGYLDTLPKTYREVLLLRRVHQLSYKQIADRLGISMNAVEKRLIKATHLLMIFFKDGEAPKSAPAAETNNAESTGGRARPGIGAEST